MSVGPNGSLQEVLRQVAERRAEHSSLEGFVLSELALLHDKVDHGNEMHRANGAALDLILKAMGLDDKRGDDG